MPIQEIQCPRWHDAKVAMQLRGRGDSHTVHNQCKDTGGGGGHTSTRLMKVSTMETIKQKRVGWRVGVGGVGGVGGGRGQYPTSLELS